MTELQRYAYPLFDSEGQRYYYVMDEFGSRVRMNTEEKNNTNNTVNTTYGVVQSLLDGYTYTVFWLHKDVPAGGVLRRAPQHRLSLLGRGKEAWETRFEYETVYDWYGGWDDGNGELKDIVLKHVPDKLNSRILIVGTGTSTFPMRMCEAGYQHVHGTDYVDAVVEKMSRQTQERRAAALADPKDGAGGGANGGASGGASGGAANGGASAHPTWEVMDATDMTCKDASYDVVLDKGCLDAMLIPPGSTGKTTTGSAWIDTLDESTMAMQEMTEVARVLKPGGILLLFSFHPMPGFIDALAKGQLELMECYEITNMNPNTRVPTTKTFVDMFRVYIFEKRTTTDVVQ